MNEISKVLVELAKKNYLRFNTPGLLAAAVTGSVSKGIADDNSDIDTLLFYKEKFTQDFYNKIVSDAKESGGDLYLGNPEEGFAVYYYIDCIRCDFAFIPCETTEELFKKALENHDTDPVIHLVINGIINSIPLFGKDWIDRYINRALPIQEELRIKMIKEHLKFHSKWELTEMVVKRGDTLYYYECLLESLKNITGILCGLNGMYLPGKIKGVDFAVNQMKIKPENFINRYNRIFSLAGNEAVDELYKIIEETLDLVDKHMPEVSTARTREIQKMILRK